MSLSGRKHDETAPDGWDLAAFCRVPPTDADVRAYLDEQLAEHPELEVAGTPPIVAVVSQPVDKQSEALEGAVRRRHEFLAALAGRVDTIPVRWGCRIPSLDWLSDHITEHERELVETFDRVGGCLERVVRIPRRDDSAADRQATDRDDAGAGTAYLQKRAESVAREPAPDDAQWVRWRSRLDPVTCEMQALVQPADACDWYDGLHLEVTALYPSGTYGRFAEAIREGMPQETERAAAVTDALPPYSFVGGEWFEQM
jgi:hypothetical protein